MCPFPHAPRSSGARAGRGAGPGGGSSRTSMPRLSRLYPLNTPTLNGERGTAGVPPGPARSGRRPGAGTRHVSPPLRPHAPRLVKVIDPEVEMQHLLLFPGLFRPHRGLISGLGLEREPGTSVRVPDEYPVRLASGDLPAEQPSVEVRERMRIRAVQDHRRKRKPRFPGHDHSVHSTRCRRVICPSAGPPLSVVPRTVAPVTIRAAGASRTRPAPVTARGGGASSGPPPKVRLSPPEARWAGVSDDGMAEVQRRAYSGVGSAAQSTCRTYSGGHDGLPGKL